LISFNEFQKTELKVAKITKAEDIEGKDKLVKLEIDLGEETPRTLVAGLKPAYSAEELVGKTIVVVANLEPAKIAGIESNGMLLAADSENGVVLLTLDRDIAVGSSVM